jgi:hypothetical protein
MSLRLMICDDVDDERKSESDEGYDDDDLDETPPCFSMMICSGRIF